MQLVERHVIGPHDLRFPAIDQAAFAAKNLYNAANYLMRQTYIFQGERVLSKCSFLDAEPLCHHEQYAGKQVQRGLFRAADGRSINADVNGAHNIIRKVAPDAFAQGSRGPVVHPVRLAAPSKQIIVSL